MSNQTKPAPPKIVVAPDGKYYSVTAGKEYEVVGICSEWDEILGHRFQIINDKGNNSNCLEFNCSHIQNKDWIIKEREVSHD